MAGRVFGLLALLSSTHSVEAQAWVAPAHVGSLSLGFQWIDNTGHLLTDGVRDHMFPGKSTDAAIYLNAEYAFTDRLSVEAGLPYVFAKYRGPGPTPGPPGSFLPVDSCFCWNSDFQDFGLSIRYNAIGEIGGAFALTPSVSIGKPSHSYDFRGEAVVGRNLDEIALAVAAGQRLDAISPRLSVQARYAYAFVERVLDISTNRSNFAFETAYQISRRFAARGLLAWQWTHGGLRAGGPTLPDLQPPGEINSPERFKQHDRLLRNNYFHAGAGISYSLSLLDFYASYIEFVNGTDTHTGRAFTVGVSWPFELAASRNPR